MPAEEHETRIPCGSGTAANQPVNCYHREAESVLLDRFFKYIYIERFILRNWLTQLWGLLSPKFMGQYGNSKITADGNCSHEIKRHLLLGRKVMANLDSILKSRDIILPTKVRLVKAMVFPVVMYGCESWTVKKAEC